MVNVQGGLPADPYNPERQPLQVALNNPPCIPQFSAPGFMNDLIPVIAAAIALDIQNAAPNSPPRMFVFNMVSRNNYQNELFAGLVMGVVDWVCLGLADNKFNNPEAAAQALIPKMCEIFVASQIVQYAELQNDVPPQMQAHITGLVQMSQNVQNEIGQFKQSPAYARMMQGTWQPGGGGQQWGQPQQQTSTWGQPTNQGGGSWGGGQRWGGGSQGGGGGWMTQQRQQQAPRQFTGLNSGSSGLFSGGVQNVAATQVESSSFNTSRFESRPGDNHKSAWVPPAEAETVAVKVAEEVKPTINAPQHVDVSKLNWRPSIHQPYQLAYNPLTHLSYLQKQPDGSVIQLVQERTESSMEREKHRLPTAFGSVPKHIDITKSAEALQRVSAGVRQLSLVTGDGEAGEEAPAKPLVQVAETAWVLEPSESLVWLQGTLKCASVMKDVEDLPDVYRIRAQVAEPFVSTRDETGAIESFAEAKSYTELSEMMLSVQASLSGPLFAAVNRRMTDLINRILSQSLSIPDIRITSFVEDVADLPAAIEKFYGETFSNAFLGNQVRNIQAAFAKFVSTLEGEDLGRDVVEAGLTDQLLNDREYPKTNGPKITYLVSNMTLTYLNLAAVELSMELDPKDRVASMITTDMPELLELAESIFDSAARTLDSFLRHLVRTSDDHVLEITQGLIGADVYLVRKIR